MRLQFWFSYAGNVIFLLIQTDPSASSSSYFPQIHPQIIQLTDEETNKGKKLNGFPAQSPGFSGYHVENINSGVVYKSTCFSFLLHTTTQTTNKDQI